MKENSLFTPAKTWNKTKIMHYFLGKSPSVKSHMGTDGSVRVC